MKTLCCKWIPRRSQGAGVQSDTALPHALGSYLWSESDAVADPAYQSARPVIAVLTSGGNSVALGGLAALMGTLSGCAPGVTVVNIDNGFGAAIAVAQMNTRP